MPHPVVLLVAHDRAGSGHVMHVYPRGAEVFPAELIHLFTFTNPTIEGLSLTVDPQPRRGVWAFEGEVSLEGRRPVWSGAWLPLAEAVRRNLVLWEHVAGGAC